MNISEIEIQNIRPNPVGNKILGNVTFYISGGVGDRFDVLNFECLCELPVGETAEVRAANLKNDMKTDAIRQAKRMPEIRSGNDALVFLCPND